MKTLHLVFHYVREPNGINKFPLSTTPGDFERKILTLKEDGFTFITLREYASFMAQGKSLPEKSVTLSFDDGLREHYQYVARVLWRHDIPATFFVIAEAMEGWLPWIIASQYLKSHYGGDEMRSWVLPKILEDCPQFTLLLRPEHAGIGELCRAQPPELRVVQALMTRYVPSRLLGELMQEFIEAGEHLSIEKLMSDRLMTKEEVAHLSRSELFTIASHTRTHPYLPLLGTEELVEEFRRSKQILSDIASSEVTVLGYPFGGDMPMRVLRAAQVAGYTSAWNYLVPGMIPRENTPFDISRVDHSEAFTT